MNLNIQTRKIEISGALERLVERQAGKIGKILPSFSAETLDLNVLVERLPRGNQHQTVLVLTTPQRVIRVEEIDDNATSSLVRAFHELRRRVKRFKSQLNRERLWHKEPVPAGSEGERVEATPVLHFSFDDHLDKVETYLRRELYHQVVAGSVPPGIIDPHALVDELFVELSSSTRDQVGSLTPEQWLVSRARHKLQERLKELNDHREDRHVEEQVLTTSRWEDEASNFYQPDESLRLEDLIRDTSIPSPEEILAGEEAEEQMQRAVAHLPADLRESFVLFAIEGFTSDEVAMITGKTTDQILADVAHARQHLREEIES